MKSDNGAFAGAIAFIFVVALILGAVFGWVFNILALIKAGPLATWAALEVFRVIGIFIAPLGAVLGWV